jgi:acyl-CoA reductase-like NAD-dependent aldehyde dehydrogenase
LAFPSTTDRRACVCSIDASERLVDRDPCTGNVLVEIPAADDRDLDAAYAAAVSMARSAASTGIPSASSVARGAKPPKGVVSVIIAPGRKMGDALVLHPVFRVVSFTGSTPARSNIARHAARSAGDEARRSRAGRQFTVRRARWRGS